MKMQKEYIKEGMRIKHPSGVTVTTSLENLLRLKEFKQKAISFFQDGINLIDADIAKIEAVRKAQNKT